MPTKILARSLVLFALLALAVVSLGAAPPVDRENAPSHAPDRLLVKFKAGTDASTAASVHRQNGGTVIDTIPRIDVQVVSVPAGSVPARAADYRRNASVLYAEPDYVANAVVKPSPPNPNRTPTPTPTPPPASGPDPYLSQQWGMLKVQAPEAWQVTTGSQSVKIAILDTGIDQDHPDLAGKIGLQASFVRNGSLDDKYGHGTHVAGIAAAITNNSIGVAGLGYNSSLMNGKVLDDRGSGYYSWVASGIIWAADNGAKVVNMSLGGSASDDTLASAVTYAWGKGLVIVAAAGNDGVSNAFYPAAYTNCIAVGATDGSDARASWSNFGDWVDVAAPGVNVYSTYKDGGYTRLSGTSMAAPHVAGLAGLVWATSHGSSNTTVRYQIEHGAVSAGQGNPWTYGRINALNSVK